jgi:hypothetical protein
MGSILALRLIRHNSSGLFYRAWTPLFGRFVHLPSGRICPLCRGHDERLATFFSSATTPFVFRRWLKIGYTFTTSIPLRWISLTTLRLGGHPSSWLMMAEGKQWAPFLCWWHEQFGVSETQDLQACEHHANNRLR